MLAKQRAEALLLLIGERSPEPLGAEDGGEEDEGRKREPENVRVQERLLSPRISPWKEGDARPVVRAEVASFVPRSCALGGGATREAGKVVREGGQVVRKAGQAIRETGQVAALGRRAPTREVQAFSLRDGIRPLVVRVPLQQTCSWLNGRGLMVAMGWLGSDPSLLAALMGWVRKLATLV